MVQNRRVNFSTLRRNYTHPHEYYAQLRAHDSLYFDPSIRCWLATGYKAVTSILNDPRFCSKLDANTMPGMSYVHRQMLFMNGETHRKAQEVLLRQLSRMVKQMSDTIRAIVEDILTTVLAKGEMDVVRDFAAPISLFAIVHILGIPTDDQDLLWQLERWSDTFGDITSGYFSGEKQDVQRLEAYFRHLIAEKRLAPADDLLCAFLQAGDIFSTEEDLVANCMMVFAAGRTTTKKLLANGFPFLIEHWDELQAQYKENPRAVVKSLGEELLRMVTPTRCLIRQAEEDVDLADLFPGDHVIRKDERVLLFLDAANYDPAYFAEPDQFQALRRPNKQVAFGYGEHQCPGATLARVEIQITLELLLSTLQAKPLQKAGTVPRWNPNPNLGGYQSYFITFATD
ncbi:cytochrome P450 [Dictyobacter arantiisoli]|uniref:Cytochrome P450 n=1 Tax=Dictyobacter arantiisoli TaxID=2014874 RepID=A0A5A5TEH5_9CHLR|nr:cytochrome P450 [Dictyobacter arantiisoli]GCF09961.1 cytochrome P450 [Dictyobacter arantiisoli]